MMLKSAPPSPDGRLIGARPTIGAPAADRSWFRHSEPLELERPDGVFPVFAVERSHLATGLSAAEAAAYAGSVRNYAAAVLAYRTHNDCASAAFSHSTVESDVGGGTTSQKAVWRQDANPANPEVVAYLDPTMDHTNFVPNRYFFAADVWDFFKAHPRVDV